LEEAQIGRIEHICERSFLTIQCIKCGHQHRVLSGSKERTCPACSRELYRALYDRYEPIVIGSRNLKHLVLTSKPVKKQSSQVVRALITCFVRLLHRKPYRRVWRASIASIECKKTPSGLFYYHLHCLLDGDYVPQSQISLDWREISGFPICFIKAVIETPKRSLRYILKYVMKGSTGLVDPEDRINFKESMKSTRLIHSYGEFYNAQYRVGIHVPYPCPICGAERCWVVLEFCDTVDLYRGIPYG
jgi:ribosomal protein S27E